MRKRKIKQITLGILISLIVSIPIFISSNVYASTTQEHDPRVIFAAACATCHGAKGTGGVTWIKTGPADKRIAPRLVGAGLDTGYIRYRVRAGAPSAGMPAFTDKEITDNELNALAKLIVESITVNGVPPPEEPAGIKIELDILDADPWYTDRGNDTSIGPGADDRRVVVATGQYLKIYNTGRTWHTFTNSGKGKDSGFIGYAGNYMDNVGDLGDMGYYYASLDGGGLAAGCNRYLCKMHPYMQVEACTPPYENSDLQLGQVGPLGSTKPLGLTRVHKHPLLPPTVGPFGVLQGGAFNGEVWVTAQSQESIYENNSTDGNLTVARTWGNISVTGLDGAYQVLDLDDFDGNSDVDTTYIPDVGNNPHNSWPGYDTEGGASAVVLNANWHDNTIDLIDAVTKAPLGSARSGMTNAHIFALPNGDYGPGGGRDRFFTTHMGGTVLMEIDVDNIQLGLNPNVGGGIRGGRGPHGLWTCDNGVNILTADTFGGEATIYNIARGSAATASSGGSAPLAPSIMSGFQGGCSRGFTNNALTHDVSIYSITTGNPDAPDGIDRVTGWTDPPTTLCAGLPGNDYSNQLDRNSYGNSELRDTIDDQACSPIVTESITQRRWVHLPIQTPVSPADSEPGGHGRYMVTANKASFNVSVTALSSTTGLPTALYTFPAGLGAHGVTYGKKSACADGGGTCYYAYVTNTFEDYVSVYDLEMIENGSMGAPGSALIAETLYVEGGAVEAVVALDPVVADLCDALDLVADTGGIGCGGIGGDCGGCGTVSPYNPVRTGIADPSSSIPNTYSLCLAGDSNAITGGAYDVLDCGVGVMAADPTGAPGGLNVSLFVNNLPIGVLCPDCRSGVHVGDIPLSLTTGQALAYDSVDNDTVDDNADGIMDPRAALELDMTNNVVNANLGGIALNSNGLSSKYTYLKEEVWVDTDTVACVVNTLLLSPNTVNDCSAISTNGVYGGNVSGSLEAAGTLNLSVELDLDLGINTGGQGIMHRPPAFPFP